MYKFSRIGIVLLLLVLVSMSAISANGQEMSSGDQVEGLISTVWNEGDLEAVGDYVAGDVMVYLPPSLGVDPPFAGIEGYTMNAAGWRAGLPDLNLEVLRIVAGEDAVAARVMISGTQTETFFGIPPTDAELSFAANIIYVMNEDGLIVEEWWEWDTVLELVQLGLFTPPGAE